MNCGKWSFLSNPKLKCGLRKVKFCRKSRCGVRKCSPNLNDKTREIQNGKTEKVRKLTGRNERIDGESPSPSVDGSVGCEPPAQYVALDAHLRRPVGPIASGADGQDPAGSVRSTIESMNQSNDWPHRH